MNAPELCILFLYHKCDEITRSHLQSLRESNPEAVIVPLTDTVAELLPGSVDVGIFASDFAPTEKWRSIDKTVYLWFQNRAVTAKRYIFVEYDCFCNVDLRNHYASVWNADVAGVDLFTREENPRWKWFMKDEIAKLPDGDRRYAGGLVPFACTLMSHDSLEAIAAHAYRADVFCELRLGTLINKLALHFRRLPLPQRSTVCYHVYPWQVNRPGLFHSIKTIGHNAEASRQPRPVAARFHDIMRHLTKDREFLPFAVAAKRRAIHRLFMAKPKPTEPQKKSKVA